MTVLEENVFKADKEFELEPGFRSFGHYIIDRLTNHYPNKVLFVDATTGREWTGLEIRDKILKFAKTLVQKYELKPQTTVCICCDHSMFGVFLALAVVCAGGIVAYSYHKDPYAELLYLARKVKPKFLVCYEEDISWAKQLETDLGYEVTAIGMVANIECDDNSISGSDDLELEVNLPIECKDISLDVAFITMSSGTTGKPKAIPVTHKVCLVDQMLLLKNPIAERTIVAVTSTLDYVSGRLILCAAFEIGYKIIVLSFSTIDDYFRMIEKHRINVSYLGLTTFYNFITDKNVFNYDITSLRSLNPMGGKIIYLDELREFTKRHPHIVHSRNSYGSSETSVISSAQLAIPDELDKFATNNCGKLTVGVKVVLKHPKTGEFLGKNETGLLFAKTPALFPGYYDPDLMKEQDGLPFTNEFDENGYYPTGDLAYFSDQGELFVLGRQKELMICRYGKKVLPSELEDLLREHPAVARVCVLGIDSKLEKSLHCPRAYICIDTKYCQDGSRDIMVEKTTNELNDLQFKGTAKLCSLTTEMRQTLSRELMGFVNGRIGWEKQFTGGIVLLDELPALRSSGKPNKVLLRSLSVEEVEIFGDQSC